MRGFLRTWFLERKKIYVPTLTSAERRSFGRFTAGYDLIVNFDKQLSGAIGPRIREAMAQDTFACFDQLAERRAEIILARDQMRHVGAVLDRALADFHVGVAALRQPPELKAVYDQAIAKVVMKPAAAIKGLVPTFETLSAKALDLNDLLIANRAEFTFRDNSARTSNQRLMAEFDRMTDAIRTSGDQVLLAIERMRQAFES